MDAAKEKGQNRRRDSALMFGEFPPIYYV